MEKKFSELGVNELIIKSIEEMGFIIPTKVQHDTIPYVLNKKDLIVMSKTGSGKTGAFGIPLIQNVNKELKEPQGLILTPTRELAVQVDKEIDKMAKYMDITTTAVYGQHNIKTEIDALRNGASIITGTPGRVFDHINQKTLKTKNISYLVLDEADRMLDMGFFDQVVKIIKTLPRNRVTMLFSATMPPEIQRICRAYMKDPITLELGSDTKTVDTIKQIYYRVDKREKRNYLNKMLKIDEPNSCIIFCNTRIEVDWVQKYFANKGYEIGALHGGNTQNSRMHTVEKFKKGKLQIIVATDVAARGLHIDDLSLVVNYDVPVEKDSYVHRIGRTGRVGNSGKAITLVTVDDVWSFYEIEEHVGALIEECELPTDEMVKEAEKESTSKWTKKRKEHKPKIGHKITNSHKHSDHKTSNHKTTRHKHSDHKTSNHKTSEHKTSSHKSNDYEKKQYSASKSHENHKYSSEHKAKTHYVEPKGTINQPTKSKPTPKRDIDYREEAKKLLATNKKPTFLQKVTTMFRGK